MFNPRSIAFFIFLIAVCSASAQYSGQRIISSYYEFEEGSTEYLYGDNVVFRSGPSSSSNPLDTLAIGTEIEIVRKTEETASLNGLDWNWYKVKIGRNTGFILGGLIALDHTSFDDIVYLVTLAGVNESNDEYEYINYKVRTRVLTPTGDFYGHESELNTNMFYIEAFGNRGIEGVNQMLIINLYAEACGVDGGKIYMFNDGNRLIEAMRLADVADAGVFWFTEKVIFPEDEDGWEGVVQYEREYGEFMDEELNWTKATTHSIILKWIDGAFMPNLKEFEFGEGE